MLNKYLFTLILLGCLAHKSAAFAIYSRDTIVKKWGIGVVIGIKKIEKRHIALNQCRDKLICGGFRANSLIYQISPILAFELLKTESKHQFFTGLEASQTGGFVDAFSYNENGYKIRLDDFAKTSYFSASMYGGFRRFVFQNNYCTPFYGLKGIIGYYYNSSLGTDDPTFVKTYMLSDKNFHTNINVQFGALFLQRSLRINFEFPILDLTHITQYYKNNDKYMLYIPGNFNSIRTELLHISIAYNFNIRL